VTIGGGATRGGGAASGGGGGASGGGALESSSRSVDKGVSETCGSEVDLVVGVIPGATTDC
jgi:hypothetical protein